MSQSELENVDGETRHSRPAGDGRSEVRAVAQHFLPFSSASLSGSRRRVRTPRTTQEGFLWETFQKVILSHIIFVIFSILSVTEC